jgi:GntR family transcriptional regulator / MocR family aminotransferase
VTLPDLYDESEIVARAHAAGVGVYPLSPFRTSGRPDEPPALVLGYGTLSPAEMERGVRLLADTLR